MGDVPKNWEMKLVDMKMQNVELVLEFADLVQHQHIVGNRVDHPAIEAQSHGCAADQPGIGDGVCRGEQGHLMTLPDQFIGKIRDNSLGSAVQGRRYALHKRSDLRNFHDLKSQCNRQSDNVKRLVSLHCTRDLDLVPPSSLFGLHDQKWPRPIFRSARSFRRVRRICRICTPTPKAALARIALHRRMKGRARHLGVAIQGMVRSVLPCAPGGDAVPIVANVGVETTRIDQKAERVALALGFFATNMVRPTDRKRPGNCGYASDHGKLPSSNSHAIHRPKGRRGPPRPNRDNPTDSRENSVH